MLNFDRFRSYFDVTVGNQIGIIDSSAAFSYNLKWAKKAQLGGNGNLLFVIGYFSMAFSSLNNAMIDEI